MPKRLIIGLGLFWLCASLLALGFELDRKPKLVIRWATETEVNTAGFNLYRSETPEGSYERINDELIPGAADPLSGADYSFTDDKIEAGRTYYYQLEEVETDGTVRRIDSIRGKVPSLNYWVVIISGGGLLFGIGFMVDGVRRYSRNPSRRMDDAVQERF